jgi:hypothetical protein
VTYIALQLKFLSKFGTEIYFDEGIAGIILENELFKKGAVIEIKYKKEASEQTKTKEYSNRLAEKKDTVVIELNVAEHREVDIKFYEIAKGNIFFY